MIKFASTKLLQRILKDMVAGRSMCEQRHARSKLQVVGVTENLVDRAALREINQPSTLAEPSLLSWLIVYNRFLAAAHLVQNDVGRGLPDESLGFLVPSREPCVNRPLQFVG